MASSPIKRPFNLRPLQRLPLKLPPEAEVIKKVGKAQEAIAIMGEDRFNRTLSKMYVEGMTIRDMAKELNKSYNTVKRWLHNLAEKKLVEIRSIGRSTVGVKLVSDPRKEKTRKEHVEEEWRDVYCVFPDPDTCYILGFCVGDGSVNRTQAKKRGASLYLLNTEFRLLKLVFKKAKRVAEKFRVRATVTYLNREQHKVETRKEAHFWKFHIYSSALARMISDEASWLRWKTVNLLLTKPFIGDFLSGFWDAGGSIYLKEKPKLRAYAKVRQSKPHVLFLKAIHQAFRKMRVAASKPYILKIGEKAPRKMGDKVAVFKEDTFEIIVYQKGIPKWIELIRQKMLHPNKAAKIRRLREIFREVRLECQR